MPLEGHEDSEEHLLGTAYDRELGLGEHRLKSVPPPTTPDVPRGPQVRPQTSTAASNSQRQQQVYSQSPLIRWTIRHPTLAYWTALLVFVLVILLYFQFDARSK